MPLAETNSPYYRVAYLIIKIGCLRDDDAVLGAGGFDNVPKVSIRWNLGVELIWNI